MGKADRVLLGLIPSSERSWPTAVCLLKDTGGWLHVHANKGDEEIVDWARNEVNNGEGVGGARGLKNRSSSGPTASASLSRTFVRLFELAGRGKWTAYVRHVVKVKSYMLPVFGTLSQM
jgi:tRNA G37 N-methylase Trm5